MFALELFAFEGAKIELGKRREIDVLARDIGAGGTFERAVVVQEENTVGSAVDVEFATLSANLDRLFNSRDRVFRSDCRKTTVGYAWGGRDRREFGFLRERERRGKNQSKKSGKNQLFLFFLFPYG